MSGLTGKRVMNAGLTNGGYVVSGEEMQAGAATRVADQQLSVRETERFVHGLLNPAKRAARRRKPGYDADTARLENQIAETLGAVVHIEPGRKGAGRLVIRYSTLEQLDGIVARFGVTP